MAEATTADLLKVNKDTNKKVSFISNVLSKNIVPASAQKEKDAEAGAFKKKLIEGLSSLKDSLKDIAKKTVQVAGFPMAIVFGAIAFIIAFFTQIGKELAKLKAVLVGIKNLPQLIAGFFASIRGGLVAAREAVVARVATALKAFLEHKSVKLIGDGLRELREAFRMAREGVVLKIQNALAAFKESAVVKAIGGAFIRMRNLLNLAKLEVIGYLKTALAAFKESSFVKAIGGAFTSMRNLLNLAKLTITGYLTTALAAFKESAVVKAIGGAFTSMRNLLNLAKLTVVGHLNTALAAFKEHSFVKAIGGAFTSMRNLLNLAKLTVIGHLNTALAAFKENAIVKAIGGAFKTIAGLFGSAVGVAEGGAVTAKSGGILGSLKAGLAAFKEGAVFKAISGVGKILSGVFAGVLAVIGSGAKAATPAAGAVAGKGIIGSIGKVTGAVTKAVKAVAAFPGMKQIIDFAKVLGTKLAGLLWPITIIIGVFDFIKGFRKDEGWDGEPASFFTKIGMGISEALQGLIGLPLDMIKAGIAWILKKFGIGTTTDPETGEEMESQWMTTMKEFSFSDLIDKLIAGLWAGIGAVFDWVGLLFTDPVGAIVKLATEYVGLLAGIGKWLYNNTIKPVFDWIKGLFGFGDKEKTSAEGEVEKPEKGWLATLFTKIFPEWLTSPVSWAMKKLGLTDDSGKLTDAGSALSEAVKTGGLGSLIGDLFSKIFPEWITSPIKWIKEKIFGKEEKLTDTTADSFFSDWKLPSWDSFKDMMPEWLKDPVGWVKGLFKKGRDAGEQEVIALQTAEGVKATQAAAAQGGEQFKSAQAKNYEAAAEKRGGLGDKDRADAMQGMGFFKRDTMTSWGAQLDLDKLSELVVAGMVTSEDLDALMAEGNVDFNKEQKSAIKGIQDVIKNRNATPQALDPSEQKFFDEAVNPASKSIFVHDVHVEKAIIGLADFARAQTQLIAAYGNGGSSGGSSTVNNVTVAPSTSNTVSSINKSENTYGTVDPYTSAAGAYG